METYFTWRLWVELAGAALAVGLLLYIAILLAIIRLSDRLSEPWRSRLLLLGMVMTMQGRKR